jgi:benzoate-CoA ligase
MYWNNRAKTKATFAGDWTKSGDKYTLDADGYYTYGGRSDDMLKVGGIYVSPFEVEACLMTHTAVLEVAVIGMQDDDELVKPKAYVVLKSGQSATADALKAHGTAPAIGVLFGAIGEHLAGAPDIKMLEPIAAGDPAKGQLRA